MRRRKKMKKIQNLFKNVIAFSVVGTLCVLLNVSCLTAAERDSVELRIEKGNRLIKICEKYLEKPQRWREVARFNRMKNPDLIYPGERLRIPADLMQRVPMDGKVTFVHGDAQLQRVEEGEWAVLNLGDQVFQGSKLRTGKASSIEVTFDDRDSIFLKPNTVLGVTKSEKAGSSFSMRSFYLSIGRVITKLKEAVGSGSRIEINTPSAVASVRGTEFRVSTDKKESMRTEVLTGVVRVDAAKKTVRLKEGEGTFVQKGEPPVSPRKLSYPPKPVDLKPIYKELPLRFIFEEAAGLSSVKGWIAKDKEGRVIVDENAVKQKGSMEFFNLPDGTYYLLVQGVDEMGIEGYQSGAYEVKLRANPLPPLIQVKGDEAEFIGKTAPFTWLKVKDAAMYHVQVARDRGFVSMLEEVKDHKDESFTTRSLDYGIYYFRISSIAADGYEAGWSQTLPFRLIPPPPAPPLDKPTVGDKEISLKWRNLGEGIAYHFQMAKNPEFKEILVDKRLDKSEITVEKPKEPGIYHVRTSTIDKKDREGEFSPPQSFEVERGFPYGVLGGVAAAVGLILLIAP
jgi:hypothetical protein